MLPFQDLHARKEFVPELGLKYSSLVSSWSCPWCLNLPLLLSIIVKGPLFLDTNTQSCSIAIVFLDCTYYMKLHCYPYFEGGVYYLCRFTDKFHKVEHLILSIIESMVHRIVSKYCINICLVNKSS